MGDLLLQRVGQEHLFSKSTVGGWTSKLKCELKSANVPTIHDAYNYWIINFSLVACLLTLQLCPNSEAVSQAYCSSGGTWPFYHWKTEMSRPEIEWPSCSLMIHHISIFNSEEIRKWWSFGDRIFIPRGLASESVWKPERIISSGKQSQKVCSPSCFTNLSRRKPLILICERSLEKVHNTFQQNCGMLQGKRMMWSKYRFQSSNLMLI